MKYLNDQIAKLYSVSELDYQNWCKQHNYGMYKTKIKSDFFYRLLTGRLVKDPITGKLIVKRPRRK